MPQVQLLSFDDYREPAQRLASRLGIEPLEVSLHRFPDGESRVALPEFNAEHLLVCRSLNQPNDKLIELMLVAETAREMGVKQLSLIAPYLCYMRQDIAFHRGEAISQKIIGRHLARLFDNLITVDPHLHRTPELVQAVPCRRTINLSATQAMGTFLATHNKPYILIGPDEESEQWVSTIARLGGFQYGIAHKQRLSDKNVEITLPDIDVQQANVILVDDMISTGHTMLETANKLFELGANSINCLVTHALHEEQVNQMLRQVGIDSIWSTDSILKSENVIQLDSLLAEGVRSLMV